MRLEGKDLVVVGGSSGIGLETARLALAEGASRSPADPKIDFGGRSKAWALLKWAARPGGGCGPLSPT
jgi:NAD(P)-dependent dehydrogenase (short-subunit alcohol dehydrogenase family)